MEILPIEVLQHIFTFNTPSLLDGARYAVYPPLGVSKRWRNAALNYPRLWTNICFVLDSRETTDLLIPIEHIRAWIERSSMSDIHVSIDLRDWYGDRCPGSNYVEELCHLLVEYIAKWQSFVYQGPKNRYMELIRRRLPNAIRLKRMYIGGDQQGRSPAYHQEGELKSLPSLLVLNFSDWHSKTLPLIGGQTVTTLSLSHMPVNHSSFYRLADEMPNISHLRLDRVVFGNLLDRCESSDVDIDLVPPRVIFPNLKHLSFNTEPQRGNRGSMTRLILRDSKGLEDVKIQFSMNRKTNSPYVREIDAFPFWAKQLPFTVTTIHLAYYLRRADIFNREAELQLPNATNHLKNLKALDVKFVIREEDHFECRR
jgi:hypothetical protein